MPFPAALTHGTVALLEDQESLKAVPISSCHCLASSPHACGLSHVVPTVKRLLWQSAIESKLSVHAAHWVCALELL